MRTGYIHIYTGEGKGKTTAAIGLSLRAKSRGFSILFARFLKENSTVRETAMLKSLGIDTVVFSKVKSPLFNPSISRRILTHAARKALQQIREIFLSNRYDVIILDEFICLISEGIVSEEEALDLICHKPQPVELILTGRGATKKIIASAQYVTYMKNVKHPFNKKILARKGIEF